MLAFRTKEKKKKKMKNFKDFNIILSGVGGQGIITLTVILASTALNKGYRVRSSELHGLSQRGGSVHTHLRFGTKIHSPLISKGKGNLILALEIQEALVVSCYASKERGTIFLVNKYRTPTLSQTLSEKKIINNLKKVSKKIILIPASGLIRKESLPPVLTGIFMVSYASFKNLIPLNPALILKTLKIIIPQKYLDSNLRAFELAKRYAKKN